MRAAVLLLAAALLTAGCASVPSARMPRGAAGTELTQSRRDDLHSGEQEMTARHPWEGDWKARLYERVRARGYASLTAFAEARPTASLVALAEELGTDDIAGVQVFSGLVAEAERSNQVTRLVRSQFIRELATCLRSGWPGMVDDDARMELALALAQWIAYTPETHKEFVRQARTALLATPPPPGWRPLGPDDELLRMLLPDEQS